MAVIVFLTFGPALDNDLVDWDDVDLLVKNPYYRGLGPTQLRWMFTTSYLGHYQPLTWVTFALDYLWGQARYGNGLDPRPFHRTNNVLHAANAVLVYWLTLRLLRLTRVGGPAGSPWSEHVAAALAALLFGTHPLRVEPVVWVTERHDVLSLALILATVLGYLRAAESAGLRRGGWFLFTLAMYVLSLLTRATGVTLPIVLLLMDWYPLRRIGRVSRRPANIAARSVWLEKVPFVVLALAASVLAVLAKQSASSTISVTTHGVAARLAQACYGLVFYVRKTLLPLDLCPIYELRPPLDLLSPRYLIPVIVVLLAGGVIVALRLRGRGQVTTVVLGCYVVLLLPVLGFVQSGRQEVADRYSYLPSIPLMLLVAAGLRRAWQAKRWPTAVKIGLGAATLATVVELIFVTRRQCDVWQNSTTLWTHAVALSPQSSTAQSNYGWVLMQQQRYDEAIPRFRHAIALWSGNRQAHRNLWSCLHRQGRTQELVQAYRDSARVCPDFFDAHYDFAVVLQDSGQVDAAVTEYNAALALQPDNPDAHTNLGLLLFKRGQTAAARRHAETAIAANPQQAATRRNLAFLLKELHFESEALAQLRIAVQTDPNHAGARQVLEQWEQEEHRPP